MTVTAEAARAALRRAVLEGYSPGQKRDSVGRFGSGGSTSSGSSRSITPEEAERRLADAGVDANAGLPFGINGLLRNVDPRLLPDIVEGVESVHRQYPGIKASGTTISLMGDPLRPGLVAETNSTSNRFSDPQGRHQTTVTMYLNTKMWADADDLKKNLADQQATAHASGGWLVDPTPAGVIRHEMMHVADGVTQTSSSAAYRRAANKSESLETGVSGYADGIIGGRGSHYHERFAEQAVDVMRGDRSGPDPTPDYTVVKTALEKLK